MFIFTNWIDFIIKCVLPGFVFMFHIGAIIRDTPKYKHFLEVFDRWFIYLEDNANNHCVLDAEI